jgi:hypothetical protein
MLALAFGAFELLDAEPVGHQFLEATPCRRLSVFARWWSQADRS